MTDHSSPVNAALKAARERAVVGCDEELIGLIDAALLIRAQRAPDHATQDVRWAVNVLLEKIAEKFEGWETHDIWRSDAAMVVRGFKHDPSSSSPDRRKKARPPFCTCPGESDETPHDGSPCEIHDAAAIRPQRMPADYSAWLVEINDTTDGPEYFHLSDDGDWIKDHDKALHFARQADADRVIEYYGWTRAKAVEHMWPSHTRPECGDAT